MKVSKIVGWVLTVLLVLLLSFSAYIKIAQPAAMLKDLESSGMALDLIKKIGILEAVVALIFLIPQSAFIGAILLTGYLGGAVFAHVNKGEPMVMPVIIGVLVWVALGLRDSRIFTLALGQKAKESV